MEPANTFFFLAEEISWIHQDPSLVSNETCGEGVAQTDGEDYHTSDCKPGNLSRGGGGGGVMSYTCDVPPRVAPGIAAVASTASERRDV